MQGVYSNLGSKPPPERGRSTRSVGTGSSLGAVFDPHTNPPFFRGRGCFDRTAISILLIQNPRILGAAALAGIDDERTFLQRHTGEAPRHNGRAFAAGEHERPQVDVARGKS